jgi:hypothetical protein
MTEEQMREFIDKLFARGDYKNLQAMLDALIDEVGGDEHHFAAPLMTYIGSKIEALEDADPELAALHA